MNSVEINYKVKDYVDPSLVSIYYADGGFFFYG